MINNAVFRIAVLPGDGIGHEVTAPALGLLDMVSGDGFALEFAHHEGGADLYRRTGDALPAGTLAAVGEADAILLGAMGHPDIRYPDGREIAPQVDMREHFGLFAGVRPVRTWPGLEVPLADPRAGDLDFILIRESTEGLFAGRATGRVGGDAAHDTLTITRAASERLFDFAFDLARSRRSRGHPGKVTCIDKANVFRSFRFFREIFLERASGHPDIEAEVCHVDAAAMHLVRNPWIFDVAVTENMFGDILSDLGAALMGGLGMAPSADIGARHAVFQPCHGTAPDIAGQGKANPTAMILSAAMMLDWLGRRHDAPACIEAARRLDRAVCAAFAEEGISTVEVGGGDGTDAVAEAVARHL